MKTRTLIGTLILGGILFASAVAHASDDGNRADVNVDRGSVAFENQSGSSSHGADTGLAASPDGVSATQTVRADKVAVRGDVTIDPAERTLTLDRCVAAYQIQTCDGVVLEIAPAPGPAGPAWLTEGLATD